MLYLDTPSTFSRHTARCHAVRKYKTQLDATTSGTIQKSHAGCRSNHNCRYPFTLLSEPTVLNSSASQNRAVSKCHTTSLRHRHTVARTHASLLISDTGASVCVFCFLGGGGKRWMPNGGWPRGRWRRGGRRSGEPPAARRSLSPWPTLLGDEGRDWTVGKMQRI